MLSLDTPQYNRIHHCTSGWTHHGSLVGDLFLPPGAAACVRARIVVFRFDVTFHLYVLGWWAQCNAK